MSVRISPESVSQSVRQTGRQAGGLADRQFDIKCLSQIVILSVSQLSDSPSVRLSDS